MEAGKVAFQYSVLTTRNNLQKDLGVEGTVPTGQFKKKTGNENVLNSFMNFIVDCPLACLCRSDSLFTPRAPLKQRLLSQDFAD